MSFIDLKANHVWSESDIVNRSEALIRAEVSLIAERILNRKVQGAALGQYTFTVDEQNEIQHFSDVTLAARQAGDDARADMALLHQVFSFESAERVLAGQDASTGDRASAQAVIDGAAPDVLALVGLRKSGVMQS